MIVYYIDEALGAAEEADVLETLSTQGRTVDRIEHRRIACVFPAPSAKVTNEKMLDVLKGHLRNAAVPAGVQSIFVIPKDGIRWAVLLQEAFYLVTGFYPIVIQPWEVQPTDAGDALVRRDQLRIIDMHAVMAG